MTALRLMLDETLGLALSSPRHQSVRSYCGLEVSLGRDVGAGMMVFGRLALAATFASLVGSVSADAQTIYPLDRAEFLAGGKFDLKVEFSGAPQQSAVKVTINGQDAAKVLGSPPEFKVQEDGLSHSAYWIRGASIKGAGNYVIEATAGDKSSKVAWKVYATPQKPKAKNVILFIGDGMTIAHRTAARILSKGIKEGRYGGNLAIDDMPHMALISTAATNTIVTDSANSMSAYTTGHKSCNNALGVYCAKNTSNFDHPKVETIGEVVKRRRNMALGIVTTTEIEDATPAGIVAHTRRRSDFNEIVEALYALKPEVMLGGGSPNFIPKSKAGSKRKDEQDFIAKFEAAGYAFATTDTEMKAAAAKPDTKRLLGLFNTKNLDGALDRRILKKGSVKDFPDQPDLVDQTKVALSILAKNPNGFMLMVESGRIDKYTHSMDWERAVYDVIMLDNAVKAAKEWAAKRNDTMIVVVPDHAHPTAIIGNYIDERPGQLLRDKLGIYEDAGFPNYPAPDKDGYPPSVDVSRRLAFVFGASPDTCETGKPYLNGENVPTQASADAQTRVANEENCKGPGPVNRRVGNLPFAAGSGIHAGDDVLLTAMGPGSEQFKGHMENIAVFRAIATALGLGVPQK
jgi:alkaline phosphatase